MRQQVEKRPGILGRHACGLVAMLFPDAGSCQTAIQDNADKVWGSAGTTGSRLTCNGAVPAAHVYSIRLFWLLAYHSTLTYVNISSTNVS